MSNGQLQITIVTPERSVLEDSCEWVSLPASQGYVTLLPGHTPLISTLAIGVLSYRSAGAVRKLALAGGFFEVSSDRVAVLADQAELPQDIDAEQARQEAEEARQTMGRTADEEQRQARRTHQLAQARLAVVGP